MIESFHSIFGMFLWQCRSVVIMVISMVVIVIIIYMWRRTVNRFQFVPNKNGHERGNRAGRLADGTAASTLIHLLLWERSPKGFLGSNARFEPSIQTGPAVQMTALRHNRLQHGIQTNVAAKPGVCVVTVVTVGSGGCCCCGTLAIYS